MANINLYQVGQGENKVTRSRMADVGMIFAIIFFVLVMLAYAGIFFYVDSLEKKHADLLNQEKIGRESLDSENVNRIASLQQRLELIKSHNTTFDSKSPGKMFAEIQSSMVNGVVVEKMDFNGTVLEMNIAAGNLGLTAQQIASFKNNPFFSGISAEGGDIREKGVIGTRLKMSVNK